MTSAWSEFHRRWPALKPPQSPTPEVAVRIAAALDGHDERVLLLGVTPALAGIGRSLVAADRSPRMIAEVWPGDDHRRSVVAADWRTMEPVGGPFSAAIGDGSLNCVNWPGEIEAVFARLAGLLCRPARTVFRVFMTPDDCEGIDALATAVLAGRVESFHALKWRLGMAACAEQGRVNIGVEAIGRLFDRLFPDRDALARRTGWGGDDIATIDFYRDSPDMLAFPTLDQLRAVIPAGCPAPRLIASGDYPLAERCPLVVIDWPA